MTEPFQIILAKRGLPWALITGGRDERRSPAIEHCDEAIAARFSYAEPLR